jgi:hypothetical protein
MGDRKKKGKKKATEAIEANPSNPATSPESTPQSSEQEETSFAHGIPERQGEDRLGAPQIADNANLNIISPTEPQEYLLFSEEGQSAEEQLQDYFLSAGGPLIADWDTSVDFSRLRTFFEPQGELADAIGPHSNPLLSSQFSDPLNSSYPAPSKAPPVAAKQLQAPPITDDPSAEDHATESSSMQLSSSSLKRKATSDVPMFQGQSTQGSSLSKRPSLGGGNDGSRTVTLQVPDLTMMEGLAHGPESSRAAQERGSEDVARGESSRKTADILPKLSPILPPGKVFPIRIGSELFHLSGASISSDGE